MSEEKEITSNIEIETTDVTKTNPEGDSWAFIGTAPSYQDAVALLDTIPPIFGVKTSDFTDHILPLMQRTKVQDASGNTKWVEVWRLYMTVAGRVAMIQKACEINDWHVDFQPEVNVPEGNSAGFLFTEPNLVYREYCNIYKHDENGEVLFLGSKPGMSMGKQGANAFEKIETSARGRSIAAWGFGVLPGSGIASLEEMESVKGANVGQNLGGAKRTKGQILTSVNDLMKSLEKVRGNTADTVEPKILGFVKEQFNADTIAELQEGQLILLERKIRASLAQESD